MASTAILRGDYQAICGDAFRFAVVADAALSAVTLRCTVKRWSTDTDAAALSVATSDGGGGIVLDDDDEATAVVTFGASETEAWPIGVVHVDLQAVDGGGGVHTLLRGQVKTRSRVTLSRIEIASPLQIFGDDLGFWLRAEDFVPAVGATAAHWPSVGATEDLGTFDVARSPSASTGIGGLPTVLSDGSDDVLAATFNTSFAVGSRPYIAMLMRAQSATLPDPAGAVLGDMLTTFRTTPSGPGSITPFRLSVYSINDTTHAIALPGPGVSPRFVCSFNLASTFNGDPANVFHTRIGIPYDTATHVLELGLENALSGHFRIDGVVQDTLTPSSSGTPNNSPLLHSTMDSIVLMKHQDAQVPTSLGCNIHIRDLIAARRIPTDSERARLLAYLQHRQTAA